MKNIPSVVGNRSKLVSSQVSAWAWKFCILFASALITWYSFSWCCKRSLLVKTCTFLSPTIEKDEERKEKTYPANSESVICQLFVGAFQRLAIDLLRNHDWETSLEFWYPCVFLCIYLSKKYLLAFPSLVFLVPSAFFILQSNGKGQPEENGRPGAIISNHLSYIDILYHMSSSFPSFVAKVSKLNMPLGPNIFAILFSDAHWAMSLLLSLTLTFLPF